MRRRSAPTGRKRVRNARRQWPIGPRRLSQLYLGLVGYGTSLALMVRARLGLAPWDVLHQGIARRLHVQIGWVVIAVSAVVLLLWIPLRQRPGFGTLNNLVLVGLVTNLVLDLLSAPRPMAVRIGFVVSGILLNALSTGLYIGAGLGPGPRDGLMTGIAARGHSLRLVRLGIEGVVLLIGFALGGSVGFGTVAYALAIGPMVHFLLPRMKAPPVAVPAVPEER